MGLVGLLQTDPKLADNSQAARSGELTCSPDFAGSTGVLLFSEGIRDFGIGRMVVDRRRRILGPFQRKVWFVCGASRVLTVFVRFLQHLSLYSSYAANIFFGPAGFLDNSLEPVSRKGIF